ncbi:MAG: DUF192 domain-containing protein [Vulcanimicrobiaceae bacterium]
MAVRLAAFKPTATVAAPKATLRVAVADTDRARERGLMGVAVLPAHAGMVFVFDADGPVQFWMKNTLIPLDMVFVSAHGTVRSVASWVPTVPPTTPDDRIPRRDGVGKYVIELNAGEAARDGIVPGAKIGGITRLTPPAS